ncbi:MAG TPA: hypothetical protein VHF90_10465 [Thermoleophilaceae bacterium]|nr:hypothetical protein [Thermoleophilaceae bacterium]
MQAGRAMRGWLVGVLAIAACLATAPAAHAAFGIQSFEAKVTNADESDHYEQAGGHPHFGITDILFNTTADGSPDGNVKDLRVDPPAGLVSNPQALPQCTDAERNSLDGCPPETQLGTEELVAYLDGLYLTLKVPFYNMTFDDTQVSRFGFNPERAAEGLPGVPAGVVTALEAIHPVDIIGGVRWESDYGVFFTIDDTGASPEVISSKLKFFGVPASDDHDVERGQACVGAHTVVGGTPVPVYDYNCGTSGNEPSSATPTPFLTNPTRCPEQKLMTLLTAWSHAVELAQAESFTTTRDDGGEGPANCGAVPFQPSISLTPDTSQPDSPTGPLFNLHLPTDGLLDPGALSTSHVKDASVTLPPGMTLNPSAANGLEACTDEQLALGTRNPVTCPPASHIGAVSVRTPLLPSPLQGSIFVGQPQPGNQYRVFLVADGHGVSVRLKGSAVPDPITGQLTVSFANNPQQAFEDFTLDVRDGPRAPLATPLECGPKTTTSLLTPYAGTPPATPSSGLEIAGQGCPAPFQPGLAARTARPVSGAFAPFGASIARPDRNQYLSGVRVDTPPGLGAMISRVQQCPAAAAATGACPAASRIGTATTRSGAGPEPFTLAGPVYFTGPYGDAPFGMVVAIRAIAGPYDLGTVVVRQKVYVDPVDAHVTVVSDPLPRILEGVPIRLRDVNVTLDRNGFVYNPTSCGQKQVGASLQSIQGAAAGPSATVRFDNCDALSFRPKMRMRLTGKRQIKLGRHPGLRVRVTQTRGQANIGRARVKLPLSLALDPNNARAICGFEAGLRADCPAKSRIGTARAISPALNRPLRGPVYFVQGIRVDPKTGARIRTLPSLLAKLRGEVGIHLRGSTAVVRRRLVSTFEKVPDAPVSRFDMRLKGGKGGILAVAAKRGLCARRKQFSRAVFTGQNGKRVNRRVKMATPCKRKASRRRG